MFVYVEGGRINKEPDLQIRVGNWFFFIFLNQNVCCTQKIYLNETIILTTQYI